MAKTAFDPNLATSGPQFPGRHAAVVTPGAADLAVVTKSLIVSASTGGSITLIMADDADAQAVTIPIQAGTWQLSAQVRAVTAASNATVIAVWGG